MFMENGEMVKEQKSQNADLRDGKVRGCGEVCVWGVIPVCRNLHAGAHTASRPLGSIWLPLSQRPRGPEAVLLGPSTAAFQ